MLKVENNEILMKKICIIFICLLASCILIIAMAKPLGPTGEIDSTFLPIISLQERLSLRVQQSDIDMARKVFPDYYANIYDYNSLYSSKLAVVEDGGETGWYPYYFGAYPAACLPIFNLLGILDLNQSYTVAITNAALLIGAILIVFFQLKANYKEKLISIFMLSFNPVIWYLDWESAEIFLFVLVTISTIYLFNNEHKKAGLFVSIAGSVNPTIMVYGMAIILHYFLKKMEKEKNLIKILKTDFLDIIKFAVCFVPSLIPFIYNYIHAGKINFTSFLASNESLFARFFSYSFDLNLGLVTYYPVALFLFIAILVYGFFKKDKLSICIAFGFFGTIFAFSFMSHINCGMSGIARYNLWISPILLLFVIHNGARFFAETRFKVIFEALLYLSAFATVAIVLLFTRAELGTHPHYFTPTAKFVLNNKPSLYNPFYATFINRTTHVDGGYAYTEPVIYYDDNGEARKILYDLESADKIYEMLSGDAESMQYIKQKVENVKNESGFKYINIDKGSAIKLTKKRPLNFDPANNKALTESAQGLYSNEGDFHWLMPNATIWLEVGNKVDTGIQIKYGVNETIFSTNIGKNVKSEIYIDGKNVKTLDIISAGVFSAVIEKELIPKKDSNKEYKIEIKTNAYFNPAEIPEMFGVGAESRDLAIQLIYLGE